MTNIDLRNPRIAPVFHREIDACLIYETLYKTTRIVAISPWPIHAERPKRNTVRTRSMSFFHLSVSRHARRRAFDIVTVVAVYIVAVTSDVLTEKAQGSPTLIFQTGLYTCSTDRTVRETILLPDVP